MSTDEMTAEIKRLECALEETTKCLEGVLRTHAEFMKPLAAVVELRFPSAETLIREYRAKYEVNWCYEPEQP